MVNRGPAVIVMARAPISGEGKTRLRTVLSDQECLNLQEAFVQETVQVALDAALGPVFVAFTPARAAVWADRTFGTRTRPFPQSNGNLGDRMLAALQHVQEQGHAPLLLIGTDIPRLRPRHLWDALKALTRTDFCLGPTEDGGYYLLGCHQPVDSLFDDITWGTDAVLETTLQRTEDAGLRCELIDELYDVDRPEDLERYRQERQRQPTDAAQTLTGA
ncbi:MAG: TIGR04282 family arsenosugar biosynthesis glycosyltransferase [Chloroflexi bacterium]|nr:TIGR04282 family arsenosugar biosynthesis glycosyltransferase [Chloroflexota bacterium]